MTEKNMNNIHEVSEEMLKNVSGGENLNGYHYETDVFKDYKDTDFGTITLCSHCGNVLEANTLVSGTGKNGQTVLICPHCNAVL